MEEYVCYKRYVFIYLSHTLLIYREEGRGVKSTCISRNNPLELCISRERENASHVHISLIYIKHRREVVLHYYNSLSSHYLREVFHEEGSAAIIYMKPKVTNHVWYERNSSEEKCYVVDVTYIYVMPYRENEKQEEEREEMFLIQCALLEKTNI